jgi:hypothetical protein
MEKDLYTCIGKGGIYELVGTSINVEQTDFKGSQETATLGIFTGAGAVHGRLLSVYKHTPTDTLFHVRGKDIDTEVVLYSRVGDGKKFYRNKSNFNERMEKLPQ